MPGTSSIDRSSGRTCSRGKRRNAKARGERPPQFFLDRNEQPYLTPDGRPFALTRVWGHGGKTNVWGRVSLRYSQMDLKAAERDGWEIPWPIAYADIAPYYDQVEQLIGVCGGTDDSDVLPGSKFLQPPPAPRCGERLLQKGMRKLGHPGRGRAPRQHDAADARVSGVPLLRQLRRRLRYGIVLLFRRSPAAVRAEDRATRDSVERGRGAHPDRRERAGDAASSTSIGRPAPSVRRWRRSSSSARAASTRRASC